MEYRARDRYACEFACNRDSLRADFVSKPALTQFRYRFDTLIGTQNLTALDVIKLDLEGAELRALTTARETLRRWQPLLLFEAAGASLASQGGVA